MGKRTRYHTETGSYYDFREDRDIYSKNDSFSAKFGTLYATPDWRPAYDAAKAAGEAYFPTFEWVQANGREDEFPKVGECLYVSGLSGWHLSTKIVRIEEID